MMIPIDGFSTTFLPFMYHEDGIEVNPHLYTVHQLIVTSRGVIRYSEKEKVVLPPFTLMN